MGFFDSLFGKKKEDAAIKKICPVCGSEFSDKGMDVSDGTICLSCWEIVMDDFESGILDEQGDFFIAPIKAAVQTKKAEQDAISRAKAQKPENCPICGGKMPKFMTMETKDGYICDACFGKFSDLEDRKETEKALEDMTIKELSALFALAEKKQEAKNSHNPIISGIYESNCFFQHTPASSQFLILRYCAFKPPDTRVRKTLCRGL